jgi:7-cyano-7-deazaguanine reductase
MNALSLGKKPSAKPTKKLETFVNPCPSRDFHIHMQIPELRVYALRRGSQTLRLYILITFPIKNVLS